MEAQIIFTSNYVKVMICVGAGEKQVWRSMLGWPPVWRDKLVGLVRGTQWPTWSSAGHMVARRARRSREQGAGAGKQLTTEVCVRSLLVWPQDQHRARTTVAAKSWVGLVWRSHLVRGVCSGLATKPLGWLILKAAIVMHNTYRSTSLILYIFVSSICNIDSLKKLKIFMLYKMKINFGFLYLV
jgi:hypothetical protein